LSPLVNRLERWRIPRSASAAVLIVSDPRGDGSAGLPAERRREPADRLFAHRGAEAAQTLRARQGSAGQRDDRAGRRPPSSSVPPKKAPVPTLAKQGVTRVSIEKPACQHKDYLVTGTLPWWR